MSAEEVIATATVAGVAVTLLGGMAALTFSAGRHSERLNTAEDDIKGLKRTTEDHAKSISTWEQAVHLLQEVRDDVKSLMTGKIQPARRQRAED